MNFASKANMDKLKDLRDKHLKLERVLIEKALKVADGHLNAAAKYLGTPPTTLLRALARHDLRTRTQIRNGKRFIQ